MQMGQLLLERFPAADTAVNREVARLLAYWEIPGTIDELTTELENSSHSREQQIHYAEMLSQIEEGWEAPAVERMTAWLEKVYAEDWRGGASFAGAINRILLCSDGVIWFDFDTLCNGPRSQEDYIEWRARFGNSGGTAGAGNSLSVVPEPSALVLAVTGFIACLARRKQLLARNLKAFHLDINAGKALR